MNELIEINYWKRGSTIDTVDHHHISFTYRNKEYIATIARFLNRTGEIRNLITEMKGIKGNKLTSKNESKIKNEVLEYFIEAVSY